MFPNTSPLVSGPSAPAQPSPFIQAANYINPALSGTMMMQSSPYTQYQQATQSMQQQMANQKQNGVGAMVQQNQGGPGGSPNPFQAPPGMNMPQAGGY